MLSPCTEFPYYISEMVWRWWNSHNGDHNMCVYCTILHVEEVKEWLNCHFNGSDKFSITSGSQSNMDLALFQFIFMHLWSLYLFPIGTTCQSLSRAFDDYIKLTITGNFQNELKQNVHTWIHSIAVAQFLWLAEPTWVKQQGMLGVYHINH